MGEDKALKQFLGRPLIQRVIERIAPIADEVVVTTNRPEAYAFLGLRLASDRIAGRGALGGLHTALEAAVGPLVAVVACDMPFASARLIEHARELMRETDLDVVIPESTGGLEPLHAVYRKTTCLPAIQEAIAADAWKVVSWLPKVHVRVLSRDECQPMTEDGLAFWNLNTPEEFAEGERRASEAGR